MKYLAAGISFFIIWFGVILIGTVITRLVAPALVATGWPLLLYMILGIWAGAYSWRASLRRARKLDPKENKAQLRLVIVFFTLVAVILIGPIIIIISNEFAARASHRRLAAERIIRDKLFAYEKAHDRFPESLDSVSFTNTPAERAMLPEIRKFDYRLDDKDFFKLDYHK